jgi:hypothetical protein
MNHIVMIVLSLCNFIAHVLFVIKHVEDYVSMKTENFQFCLCVLCSPYQRRDAKKTLIGMTHVAYL